MTACSRPSIDILSIHMYVTHIESWGAYYWGGGKKMQMFFSLIMQGNLQSHRACDAEESKCEGNDIELHAQ